MASFEARDGRSLQAQFYGTGQDWLIIVGGTGIPARFYRRTAEHFAARGLRVMTFDYRGIASNREGRLRQERADMADWGRLDIAGAIDYAGQQGAKKIRLLAHSVGGQLFWFLPNADKVDAAVCVSSQSGHWRHWRPARKPFMWGLWHVIIPTTTAGRRPFPGKRLGMGEDLPARVAGQWAHWGRHREYLWREPAAKPAHFPLLGITVEDDVDFAPATAVEDLLGRHGGPVERTVLRASSGNLGHFGPFRAGMEPVWDGWANWLADH